MVDGYKTIDVKKHERTLPSGKKIPVSKHTRKIPYDDRLDVLSEKWVQEWHDKRMELTNPDKKEIAKITFLMPNKLWLEHPEKYDVFGLDTDKVPVYDKIPTEPGLPGQIIKVKPGKFYKCDDFGRFRKTFPLKEPGKVKLSEQYLFGGEGDSVNPDKSFSKKEIELGIEIEMEHTNNPKVAKEITTDHLTEASEWKNPNYNSELIKWEKAMKEDIVPEDYKESHKALDKVEIARLKKLKRK